MANKFLPKRSSVASAVPTTSDLVDGEVATNTADKTVYQRAGAAIVAVANFFDAANVRATLLTGLSTATSAAITATDSVLDALGKLQAQITTLKAAVVQTIADGDTTHVPSADAVFDALAAKAPIASPSFTGDATFDTNVLFVDATNNRVGVGTLSPGQNVEVSSSVDPAVRITNTGGTSNSSWDIRNNHLTGRLTFTDDTANTRVPFKFGTNAVDNLLRVGIASTDVVDSSGHFRPTVDNAKAVGSSTRRWTDVYGVQFRPGAGALIWTSGSGTPEGAITAPIGSLYTRTDGGAGTTLYVKESGVGNTGWIAK